MVSCKYLIPVVVAFLKIARLLPVRKFFHDACKCEVSPIKAFCTVLLDICPKKLEGI